MPACFHDEELHSDLATEGSLKHSADRPPRENSRLSDLSEPRASYAGKANSKVTNIDMLTGEQL